ncbi:MAG: beta-glucosidase [Eubacteriaceae bacterium]|jgi:beta-glucosidase
MADNHNNQMNHKNNTNIPDPDIQINTEHRNKAETQETQENRINSLISQMTLPEKIRMIHGCGLFQTGDIPRLGIPALKTSDGPMGVRHEFVNDGWEAREHAGDDVSYLPSNSAVAATWNPELAFRTGQVLGEETRARGKDVILAPGINIKRTPVCGRNFEYMSEDPYLTARMAVPLVQGIEESDVASCVKHFALNNQETERLWVDVEIEDRPLRELYLPAFKAVLQEGRGKSMMASYNLYRGEHLTESKNLIQKVVRDEWGYDGAVISDWGGVHRTRETAEGPLDIEMSVTSDFDDYYLAEPLRKAVEDGSVDEKQVDDKVRNVLRLMLRLKMIRLTETADQEIQVERPEDRSAGSMNTPEHHQKIYDVAAESVILLKNENKRLPLKADKLKTLLLIGDNADRQHASGGGSAEIKALYEITPLQGLKNRLGGNCEISFAQGYDAQKADEQDSSWQATSLDSPAGDQPERTTEPDLTAEHRAALRAEAVQKAEQADSVIIFAGLNHDWDLEGQDRQDINLPYEQDKLIEEVLAVRPDAVVVITAGSPVAMGSWADQAQAIVWNWYDGMEGGNVIADILLGKINPSGKLPESIPYSLDDCPASRFGDFPGRPLTEDEKKQMNAHLIEYYREGMYVGYRYYQTFKVPVRYCFGHGLSYTDFQYDNLEVRKSENSPFADIDICVKNTGTVSGSETVQLYIGKLRPEPGDPVKALKAFRKLELKPGERRCFTLSPGADAFSEYSEKLGCFVCKAGNYMISVGSSSEDIRKTDTFRIKEDILVG